MPELPEVETVVRELSSTVSGKVIDAVSAYWDRTIVNPSKGFASKVCGREVKSVLRRGKYICMILDDSAAITIHLRMTGKLIFDINERENNYLRVKFVFKDGCEMYFIDVRKFGRIQYWEDWSECLSGLGVEPLNEKSVFDVLTGIKSVRSIKQILLDQKFLAGVGNIYADESLFLAKIHPSLRLDEVPVRKIRKLSRVIPDVLNKAIQNMGTTLSDYRRTKNIAGENQNYLNVYGKGGQPCVVCKTKVEKIIVGQRGTHFCPKCQRVN